MGKKLGEFATENILIWDIKIKTELIQLLTYSPGQNLKD